MQHIIDRFISYVTIDTESDPNSNTTPSTAKQWDLANKLVDELKEIGMNLEYTSNISLKESLLIKLLF